MKKFNLNSRNARWYKFFWLKRGRWRDVMPEDTCTYYRNTIFSYLLTPFIFGGLLVSYLFPKLKIDSLLDRFCIQFIVVVLPVILGFAYKYTSNPFLWWGIGILTLAAILIGCAIVLLFMLSIQYLIEKIKERKKKKTMYLPAKEGNIIVAWYKQLKDRTCSKIKWE